MCKLLEKEEERGKEGGGRGSRRGGGKRTLEGGGDIREDKCGEVARAVQAAEERPHLSPEALMSGL